MIKTAMIVITSLIALLLIYLFPRQAINPGDLSKGHQHLENECMKCHTVFLGTPGEKCIVCHRPADIGRMTTAGVIMEAIPGQQKTAFHHLLSADSCLSCHRDHKGRDIGKADQQFSHNLLKDVNINQCTACHKGPVDNLHVKNGQECSQCHTTAQWRPATLDHARYFRFDKDHLADCASCHKSGNYKEYTCYNCHEHTPANVRQDHEKAGIFSYENCLLCHPGGDINEAKDILKTIKDQHAGKNGFAGGIPPQKAGTAAPSHTLAGRDINNCVSCHRSPMDSFHQAGGQNCAQCHTAERWRPATLDHAQYFRFDRNHGQDCLTCHRDSTYREYTCYGCHEHSPRKIEEEHREEGIGNYQDCAACHPSADENETRRVFRSERFQDRSGNGFEREEYIRQEGYGKSGYNDYEDDDDDRHEDDDDDHDGRNIHDDD